MPIVAGAERLNDEEADEENPFPVWWLSIEAFFFVWFFFPRDAITFTALWGGTDDGMGTPSIEASQGIGGDAVYGVEDDDDDVAESNNGGISVNEAVGGDGVKDWTDNSSQSGSPSTHCGLGEAGVQWPGQSRTWR